MRAPTGTPSGGVLRLQDRTVDLARREVVRSGGRSPLTLRECEVLDFLARVAGTTLSREQIYAAVWGGSPGAAGRAVDAVVTRLRAKLELDPRHPAHLLSVYGAGYRFVLAPAVAAPVPSAGAAEATVRIGSARVWLERGVVERNGTREPLTGQERELLKWLLANPRRDIGRAELLREVWGWRSAGESRAVDVAVRRLRRKLEGEGPPRHLLPVRGVGYRFEPTRGNLVREATTFVGRRAELAGLREACARGARLVTLVGTGGVGKTRLASELAIGELERGALPGGAWFVDLIDARSAPEIASAVAGAVGIDTPGAARDGRYVERIGDALGARGAMLLVLDNFEQVVAHAAETVGAWRVAAPEVRFVVTSRERLRLRAEHVHEIDPLPLSDGVALFLARQASSGGGATSDLALVEALVERLDALPLAIELAAARATMLGPRGLLERMDSLLDVLDDAPLDVPSRHRSMRAAIAWSWQLLSDPEREALARCVVFRGAFTLEAAAAALDLSRADLLDVLHALHRKSLVRRRPTESGHVRFALLETVRAFAAEQLGDLARSAAEARRAAHASRAPSAMSRARLRG